MLKHSITDGGSHQVDNPSGDESKDVMNGNVLLVFIFHVSLYSNFRIIDLFDILLMIYK